MARLSTLILLVSKRSTNGSPHPHWPPAPSAWPLRTVESPTRNSVGRAELAGGFKPIFAWAAGSVVEPSIGADLAGSWARSGLLPKLLRPHRTIRQRGRQRATGKDTSFFIGTIYACIAAHVKRVSLW